MSIKFRSDLIYGLLKNDGDTIGNLVRSWTRETPVILCQGYGVGRTMPLRALAYAVPVLRLARQLPPCTKIEFYWASRGVLRANPHYSPSQIMDVAMATQRFLAAYVAAFHPNLQDRIRIYNDLDPDSETFCANDTLTQEAEIIAANIATITSFIANRGGKAALKYMVEHALYMRDPIKLKGGLLPLLVAEMQYPYGGHLVMIGGPSERVFWRLRQQLCEKIGAHALWTSHQLFTPLGDPPTYHPQPNEPFADAINRNLCTRDIATLLHDANEVGSGVLKDWLVLLQDAANVERFTISPNTAKEKCQQDVLQRGLNHLMEWLHAT